MGFEVFKNWGKENLKFILFYCGLGLSGKIIASVFKGLISLKQELKKTQRKFKE